MNGLVIAPAYNSTSGPHTSDATGAFQPRARQFAKLHGFPSPMLLDNRPASYRVRDLELTSIVSRTPGPLDVVALFCHGWRTGIQLGPQLDTIDHFARTLAASARHDGRFTVCLYACSTGEDVTELGKKPPAHFVGAGDRSFADSLRDGLLACGVPDPLVFAHTTPGDAWDNAMVRVFGAGTTHGGEWLIEPGTPDFAAWNHRMHHSDLWARAPFMTREQVLAELHAA